MDDYYEDDHAAMVAQDRLEAKEGARFFRGMLFAVPLIAAFWGAIAGIAWLVHRG